ncbi:MAG: hypothetical protein WCQ50_03000 [Spirochaetota bacterium]
MLLSGGIDVREIDLGVLLVGLALVELFLDAPAALYGVLDILGELFCARLPGGMKDLQEGADGLADGDLVAASLTRS